MADPNMEEFLRTIQSRYNGGFNPYAAGRKSYGASGRDAPNVGPTSNKEGYAERDLLARTKRNAMLKRMKAMQGGRLMSADYLRQYRPNSPYN